MFPDAVTALILLCVAMGEILVVTATFIAMDVASALLRHGRWLSRS